MFTIIGAMAELERNVIRERVVAGMEYARRHGTKRGNAIGRPRRIFDRSEIVRLRESGLSIERIAHEMSLDVGPPCTIYTARHLPKGSGKLDGAREARSVVTLLGGLAGGGRWQGSDSDHALPPVT
jgi:DNA invertase Pin-like site-specific DNA recombinase